ncbi:MAG: DUF4394 domain-containing protein [Anaerolineae bacterium]|nr:DUF4394 domain-containing protein [Phycisphaerae bacterium]
MRVSKKFVRMMAAAACGVCLSTAGVASAAVIYGVSSNNNLLQFNSASPGTIDSSLAITGMLPGENTIGLDFRPANGGLYALGSQSRLYTVDPNTGAATLVGALGLTLNGTQFGFDFNPVIDRIRVVSETDRNYVLDPNTGVATQVTNLFYGPADPNFGVNPNVVGSAYTNNVNGAASTQLYGIDTNIDILVTQANSAGTLGTVGPLGSDVAAILGFDIEAGTNIAYAAMLPSGGSISNLYTINLATGLATNLGQINGGLTIVDITAAIPEPASVATLAALGLLVGFRRR